MRMPQIDDLDLELDQMMRQWPQTTAVFLRHKMLCVGCMVAPFHTVVDACVEYDLDLQTFLGELREAASAPATAGKAAGAAPKNPAR